MATRPQKQGKKTTLPKKKDYMCMDWQVSHAYLDAVYLLPIVSSRVVKKRAITQVGRKIIVDADLTRELAGRKTGGRG